MAVQFNEGMKLSLGFVTSLLSQTLLHFGVGKSFVGKDLDPNTTLLSLEKWLLGVRTSFGQHKIIYSLVFHLLCNCWLATSGCKESRVRQPGASGFCDRASEFRA